MSSPATVLSSIAPQPPAAVRICGRLSHPAVAEHFRAGLGEHTGRHALNRALVARRIGLSPSAIDQYLYEDKTPSLANYHALLAVIGPPFANHMLTLSGMTGARRLDGTANAAGVVLAELAGETALFAKALADGRLDHIERAEVRRTLPALIHDLQELLAALGKNTD